jgi:hypothetical protein
MIIIYTTNEFAHYTDEVDRKTKPGFVIFDTLNKEGKIINHELAESQIAEIQTQEGTVDEYRENRKKKTAE